jgi:hypothetical protein
VSAELIVLQDDKAVSTYSLEGDSPVVVGRSSRSDVQVRDPKLSRSHCEIRPTPHGYLLRDLGSKNGTFVNGARVTEARLRDGDRIQIGLTRLGFRSHGPAEATDVAPPQLCAACGRLVPLDEMGDARQTEDRIYCSRCIAENALVGRTIGGYEIIQLIGRGSMGTVFKAEQLSMSRPVALKILHRELTADRDATARFLREARAGGQLSHPNIIRIYDMNQAEGLYFISMEFVPGGDVGALLDREGPLPADRVASIAAQTARALAHAHERGVIHRDVKPSNLLLGRDGLIKVADLGLAKSLDAAGLSDLTGTGTTLGTLPYLPPEQIASASHADHRADIYSLGATCYHLLAGEPPFQGDTVAQLALAVRSAEPRRLRAFRRELPVDLDALLLRCLAKDPADRYQNAADLLDALDALSG